MIIYRIIEEKETVENREVTSYGIAAYSEDGQLLDAVHCITPTKEKAARLLEKFARLGLSPVHMLDVARDFVISEEY